MVVVQKKNGKWWVYTYFADLDKACPKDSFPFLKIDMMVEATIGCKLLNFMNAYSRYN